MELGNLLKEHGSLALHPMYVTDHLGSVWL
jgi:hypothetical protein